VVCTCMRMSLQIFHIALPITTLLMMTIIRKPPGRGPLFGSKVNIVFGGFDHQAMRRWQERVRAAKNASAKDVSSDFNPSDPDNVDEPGRRSNRASKSGNATD
jgi:hypothetical protein